MLLPISVLSLTRLAAPELQIPPPRDEPAPPLTALSAIVSPTRFTLPPATKRPPPNDSPAARALCAMFAKNVLFARLTLPPATKMPAPHEESTKTNITTTVSY